MDDSEVVEIQLKLKVQDIVSSSWGNPIIVDSWAEEEEMLHQTNQQSE